MVIFFINFTCVKTKIDPCVVLPRRHERIERGDEEPYEGGEDDHQEEDEAQLEGQEEQPAYEGSLEGQEKLV